MQTPVHSPAASPAHVPPTAGDASPPPERPAGRGDEETSHTDPGPPIDGPFEPREEDELEERYRMVAEAAWYRAEQRGFEPGDEELDWLEAERELFGAEGGAAPDELY